MFWTIVGAILMALFILVFGFLLLALLAWIVLSIMAYETKGERNARLHREAEDNRLEKLRREHDEVMRRAEELRPKHYND